MPSNDLSDAAIAAHDRQRDLPAEVWDALIGGLCSHLHGQGRCLDAGVGTGSVALPLVAAGIPIVGVDVSRAMLDALRAKVGGSTPFPLVQGDLTELPFRPVTFGAVLAANVLHLIPAWRTAVDEFVRVVRPGGLLLVNLGSGGPPAGPGAITSAKFRVFLGAAWSNAEGEIGPRDAADFERYVVAHGAAVLPPVTVQFRETSTLKSVISRLEHNEFSRPRGIDQDDLRRAAAATRTWARERFGPLDEPLVSQRVITYRIFQLRREARDRV